MVRNQSCRFSFSNPFLLIKIEGIDKVIREVPVIENNIAVRYIFLQNIIDEFISELYFRFKLGFVGSAERVIFRI